MRFFSGSKNLCYKPACSDNLSLFDLFSLKRSLGDSLFTLTFSIFSELKITFQLLKKEDICIS